MHGIGFGHTIIDQSREAIAVLDENSVFLYVNPSFQALSGYALQEIANTPLLDIVYPDDRPEVARGLHALSSEPGRASYMSFRIMKKSGEICHVEVNGYNLLRESNIGGVLLGLRDVSERIAAEEALAESEERFRLLTEQSMVGVIILRDGLPLYVNHAMCEITGYSADEIAGFAPWEFGKVVHPEDRPFVLSLSLCEQRGMGEQVRHYMARIVRKNAELRYVEFYFKTIRLHGKPAVFGFLVDVTERERTRKVLEEVSRLFLNLGADAVCNIRLILEKARLVLDVPLAFYYHATGESMRFTVGETEGLPPPWNHFLERLSCIIMERDPDEPLLVRDLCELPGLKDAKTEMGYFSSLLGYSLNVRGKVTAALGFLSRGDKSLEGRDVEVGGMFARALCIEEERLSQHRNLRDLVDIISHEMRHPMTVLRGYAHLLDNYATSMDESTRREALKSIIQGVNRLEKLMNELVDASCLEHRRLTLAKRPFSLFSLLELAAEEMRYRFPDREIRFADFPDLKIVGDQDRLLDALLIVLENAFVYSPDGTPVDLEVAKDHEEVVVSVLDRGPGVPIEERTRIFQRFYQLEEARHHSRSGMGLGLYIAKEFVEAHGGRIWCADREGGGAVFRIAVPMA